MGWCRRRASVASCTGMGSAHPFAAAARRLEFRHTHRSRSMKGFVEDIEKLTEENTDFRRVLYTGKNMQLVLMSLKSGEEIGEEVHEDRDQFFRVEQGSGEVLIDGKRTPVKADDAIIV